MTVLEIIESSVPYFEKHGVPSPRLQIEHLLAHVLGLKRLQLYLQFDRPLTAAQRDTLRPLVKRRAAREPLQYILGECEFYGLKIFTAPSALIPRPETELLVEMVIKDLSGEKPGYLLDVGTGSGAIALALAKNLPDWNIVALEKSCNALALAESNFRINEANHIRLIASDLLAHWHDPSDAIVANLPYLDEREMRELAPEVKHEPECALSGGVDGSDIILSLIAQAKGRCRRIYLETGIAHTAKVALALEQAGFLPAILHDYTGRPRFVFGKAEEQMP